ncbi:hypothetical protein H0H81_009101 [Sphagnurus paluster]|uniref:Uncharacterized protein n=1 Tax=Sphagnurus paluster TaxID=117069 RepID=A0A9P7K4P5_9AGAR|nr:hypothetical protein H0H81_009101 [Sphagnurus paluster]
MANSLGLDFDQLKIQDGAPSHPENTPSSKRNDPSDTQSTSNQDHGSDTPPVDAREKKKPYVNAERLISIKDKLSEEALTERMARMREQNEKIKQRRLDVQADEDAFRKTQESERAKLAQIRKVQENVDRTREQNAKRKMDKIQSREWDSAKPTSDWKHSSKKVEVATTLPISDDKKAEASAIVVSSSSPSESAGWSRGGPRGVHRGKGRGRGGVTVTPQRDGKASVHAVSDTSTAPGTLRNDAAKEAS